MVGPMLASRAVVRRMAAAIMVVALVGCAEQTQPTGTSGVPPARASSPPDWPMSASPSQIDISRKPVAARTRQQSPPTLILASDGKPRAGRLTIPGLGIKNLHVKPYRGSPDDARGTRIQDRGMAASPYGPDGGVGPGGIGNHIITAHRTSSTRAFAALPKLGKGAKVHLVAGGYRYSYRIVLTRVTSFRSTTSLAEQSAAVPGRPGARATKAVITLSTCRTPEDHAEGNHWSDELGNPEHRIDKIGQLVAIRPI